MKRALVCGAGGFIGMHLVKKLRGLGYWVRGVDLKRHEWSPGGADEFTELDLRVEANCREALTHRRRHVRRGLPAGRGHGRDGVHPLGRNRDHAQQRPDQHLHDGSGCAPRRAALLLLVLGVRIPRHAAGRTGDDGGRGRPGPSGQRVRLGEALLRAHGRGVRAALRACRCASRASRTATGRRAHGPGAARRRRRPCAGKSPRSKTGAP